MDVYVGTHSSILATHDHMLLFCTNRNDSFVNIVDVFDILFKVKPSCGIYLSYNLKCCCAF